MEVRVGGYMRIGVGSIWSSVWRWGGWRCGEMRWLWMMMYLVGGKTYCREGSDGECFALP